jgi:hypothetical protein
LIESQVREKVVDTLRNLDALDGRLNVVERSATCCTLGAP